MEFEPLLNKVARGKLGVAHAAKLLRRGHEHDLGFSRLDLARLALEDRRVRRATVPIDKPGALRFARSVAVEITREQTN
jgi:hypothetical protein